MVDPICQTTTDICQNFTEGPNSVLPGMKKAPTNFLSVSQMFLGWVVEIIY